jgi:hypothetical protein
MARSGSWPAARFPRPRARAGRVDIAATAGAGSPRGVPPAAHSCCACADPPTSGHAVGHHSNQRAGRDAGPQALPKPVPAARPGTTAPTAPPPPVLDQHRPATARCRPSRSSPRRPHPTASRATSDVPSPATTTPCCAGCPAAQRSSVRAGPAGAAEPQPRAGGATAPAPPATAPPPAVQLGLFRPGQAQQQALGRRMPGRPPGQFSAMRKSALPTSAPSSGFRQSTPAEGLSGSTFCALGAEP